MRSLRTTLPCLILVAGLAATTVSAEGATPRGYVRLFTPSTDVTMTVFHYGEDSWADFNPAVYLKARGTRFQIDVSRPDFRHPVTARVRIGAIDRQIPTRYLDGWNGLRRAFELTWSRTDGTVISRRAQTWCPNDGQASRLDPNAATVSYFPYGCGTHPFTRSMRWGVDRGWARSILQWGIVAPRTSATRLRLAFSLRKEYAQLFGIPARERTLRFDVTVKHVYEEPYDEEEPPPVASGRGVRSASTSNPAHVPDPPTDLGPRANPPRYSRPDLISLPAFGISTRTRSGKDFLDFAATVYNGGPAPLVVEGFRRGSKPVMDAYQSFFHHGKAIEVARAGTMGYDRRASHSHWHFRDFAQYDLVDGNRKRVRTSGKEAFCLAPTDAIDLLARGAVADPGNGDLGTACGDATSIWVREVLAAGWGDTYLQSRAGQSINVTGLPNGTYWIRVTANPLRRLYEVTADNNVALRRIVLGGTAGARTVRVPPRGLVDSEAIFGGGSEPPVID